MTLGQVVINVLLIATVPTAVRIRYRSQRATVRRGVAAGAISAVLVVAALLAVRRMSAISSGTISIAVVLAEEAAKFAAVYGLLRLRTSAGSQSTGFGDAASTIPAATGWSVGAGFATAEHLLYTTAAPRIVLLRILTAGVIHTVTARCYSGVLASQPTPTRPIRVTATLAVGAVLHLGYNLLAQRLDQIPTLW